MYSIWPQSRKTWSTNNKNIKKNQKINNKKTYKLMEIEVFNCQVFEPLMKLKGRYKGLGIK